MPLVPACLGGCGGREGLGGLWDAGMEFNLLSAKRAPRQGPGKEGMEYYGSAWGLLGTYPYSVHIRSDSMDSVRTPYVGYAAAKKATARREMGRVDAYCMVKPRCRPWSQKDIANLKHQRAYGVS